jgi:hypothetical protein
MMKRNNERPDPFASDSKNFLRLVFILMGRNKGKNNFLTSRVFKHKIWAYQKGDKHACNIKHTR